MLLLTASSDSNLMLRLNDLLFWLLLALVIRIVLSHNHHPTCWAFEFDVWTVMIEMLLIFVLFELLEATHRTVECRIYATVLKELFIAHGLPV